MRTIGVAIAFILHLGASVQPASAVGINLSWSDCGAAGTTNTSLPCNTNSGPPVVLVGSYFPPLSVAAMVRQDIVLDIQSAEPVLPNWWRFVNAGSCRGTAGLALSRAPTIGLGRLLAPLCRTPSATVGPTERASC